MEVPIFIQKNAQGKFYAKAWDMSIEGNTREEAVEKLKNILQEGEITPLFLEEKTKDWTSVFGMFKDDETFDELQKTIQKNRRLEDEPQGIFPDKN
jgi:predicted RNase H-like HicB family nuclease